MYRLVILLDVEADSLEDAYERVYNNMGKVDSEDFQWESTDEAFGPDGGSIVPEEIQRARMTVFDRVNTKGAKSTTTAYVVEALDTSFDTWQPILIYLNKGAAQGVCDAMNRKKLCENFRITETRLG